VLPGRCFTPMRSTQSGTRASATCCSGRVSTWSICSR
jgi:hypothetical protein